MSLNIIDYDSDGNPIWGDDGTVDDMSTFYGSDTGGQDSNADSGGNKTYTYDDGSTLTVDANGNPVSSTEATDSSVSGNSAASNKALTWVARNLGQNAANGFQKILNSPGATIGTALAGAKVLYDQMNKQQGGYNKPVPKMDMVRQQVQYDDTNRRPGEGGRQYFTDPQFVGQGDAAGRDAANTAAATQATGLAALQPAQAAAVNPWAGKMKTNWNPQPVAAATQAQAEQAALPVVPRPDQLTSEGGLKMAHGGIAELAKGGRYLAGHTDGMADKIDTNIDGKQAAKLSHGEFVIPADVVSHLGNGNSEAGAQKLYQMMARVREARTGNPNQGKKINPNNFMPGGLATIKDQYAGGGEVKGFDGTTGSMVTGAGGVPLDTSKTSSLSPWVGDYVTSALGEGAAAAAAPYQAYKGPLTAGASDLQQQAYAGSSDLTAAGYNPANFTTGTFDAGAASKYMNPYLSAALDPQLKELQRQNTIANMNAGAKLTSAGAYGGGRQAVMNAENQRNMMDQMDKTLGQGYSTAYDKAMAQYNADQGRQMDVQKSNEASRQYSSDFGLKSLDQLNRFGADQRGITSEGIAADKAQFEEGRDWALKMPQYKLNLLTNLPTGAQTSSTNQDALSALQSNISGLGSLYENLSALGVTQPAATTSAATVKP